MRILITGSAGFIGGRLLRKLWYDHTVVGVDKRPASGTITVDARDFFRDWESGHYDLVIHCAAVVGGRKLVESPLAHAENLEIDAALFQWAERAKPGRIIYISSVAAYPAELQCCPSVQPLHEDDIDLTDAISPPDELYGWAKLTGEFLASRCSVPVSIPRPFTVYGEDQDPVFPFGNLVMQVRSGCRPLTVWGTGNQVRDLIHVDDVACGIMEMARQGVDGPVNFCTGHGITLRELAGKMAPDVETVPGPEGLWYRVGSPRLFSKFYTPRISLDEGIERALR